MGRVKKKAKREYTPEQREAMRERMAHARRARTVKQMQAEAVYDPLKSVSDPPTNHSGLETQAPTTASEATRGYIDAVANPERLVQQNKALMQTPAEALEEMQKGGDENATTADNAAAAVDATTPAPTSDPNSAGTTPPPNESPGEMQADPLASSEAFDTFLEKQFAAPPTETEKAWPAWMPVADPTKRMKVTQLPTNPRLAICSHPDHPGEQHVIVGQSENLIIGMEIPVIRDPAHPAYWLLAGPLPRSKGRW